MAIDCSEHAVAIQRLTLQVTEAREKSEWREVSALAAEIEQHAAAIQVMARQEMERVDACAFLSPADVARAGRRGYGVERAIEIDWWAGTGLFIVDQTHADQSRAFYDAHWHMIEDLGPGTTHDEWRDAMLAYDAR